MNKHFPNAATPAATLPEASPPPPRASGSTYSEYVEAAIGWAVIFVSGYAVLVTLP